MPTHTQYLQAFLQIHTLKAGLVSLPNDFTVLQASLNTKGSFSDIERLHNMAYVYGATMVEVVLRREFSASLSMSILEECELIAFI